MFKLNHDELIKSERVILGDWVNDDLNYLESALQELEALTGTKVIQKGRVIAFRSTDTSKLFSAFKAAAYLGRYNDMKNTDRFSNKMVKSHHSYEPIRGESVSFLYVGVGKPNYDHLVTYSVGRNTRIAAGQRANLPYGIEVPVETKDKEGYVSRNWQRILDVINVCGKGDQTPEVKEQLQSARSELPVGYIMPPFIFEFSEEALAKNVFRQRLWEQGAQGATIEIVNDMWECCLELDKDKWENLMDYHGSHTVMWEKAMRTLRDKRYTINELKKLANDKGFSSNENTSLYELIQNTVGKKVPTMWDKMK
ncbi:hypothetical protein NV379_01825 [Paenibacillus sp. N1-5-1-14]|uniref:hypothetical protein n=1 Tax=Paenibacillus radicibacter TaxID=2972488 RepID=UPI002158DF9D|nr:hypothetical protein [Paenibacillus radicibacter]MCR8641383.1 hypothetical protein [Paenibacillus radicibacter]